MREKPKRGHDSPNKAKRGHQSQKNKSSMWLVILGAIAGLIVLMTIIGLTIVAVESANVRSAYGERIAGLCQTVPMGEPDLAKLPAADGQAQLLLLRAGTGQRHRWHGQLPVSWRAESEAEVGLVGCVLVDTQEIESCEYQRIGPEGDTYTVRIERLRTTANITLLNPTSGERIAERIRVGSEPAACPPDSEDLDTTQQLSGSEPTAEDFQDWLESFVDGTAG